MAALFFLLIPCCYLAYLAYSACFGDGGGDMMGRSFFWERLRINIEICCESISDLLAGSAGCLKKPLLFLAAVAIVMTLRSARKSVQSMKAGGLTAGSHDPTYKALNSMFSSSTGGSSATSSLYGGGSSPKTTSSTSSMFRSSPSSTTTSTTTTAAMTTSVGPGMMSSSQPRMALSALDDQFSSRLRIMSDTQWEFKDYGGVRNFYGRVQTLKAGDGYLVVEKVLQEAGQNRILVIDNSGNKRSAVFGKTAAETAKAKGWRGVIVNGAIRDAEDIAKIGIGVKALGVHPKKGTGSSGNKDVQISVGGQTVLSNNWAYCDSDGIAFSDTELVLGSAPRTSTTPGATTTTSTYPGQTATPGTTTASTSTSASTYPGQTTTSASTSTYPGQTTTTGTTTASTSTYPGQTATPGATTTSTYPGQTATSTYPGQTTTSTYPGQTTTSTYPGQTTTSTYPGQQMNTNPYQMASAPAFTNGWMLTVILLISSSCFVLL